MKKSIAFLALSLLALLVFSSSAFAWGVRGTNTGNFSQAPQKVSLSINVTGFGNPRNVVGTLYAQVGFWGGETRGYVSTTNGTLVFQDLKPNQYYFLKLQTIGGTRLYPFIYVGKNDSTITKFV
ncbi:MAG: hypothetical protein PHD95_05390 [Candidatus ainarchaeum sp.]|nr:hypothetical protein [Candidatus ainarchaeum sp.]